MWNRLSNLLHKLTATYDFFDKADKFGTDYLCVYPSRDNILNDIIKRMDDIEESGEALLGFFRSMECPGTKGSFGDEYDWVWDIGGREFLSWLLRNVDSESNLLSASEAREWKEYMRKGIPLLEGDSLEEAQRALFNSTSIDGRNLPIESLRSEVQGLEEILETYEHAHEELTRCSEGLSEVQSHLITNEINSIPCCDVDVLKASEKYSIALDGLRDEIECTFSEISDFGKRANPSFISELCLENMKKEDEKFNTLVDRFIQKQFVNGIKVRDLSENVCYDLVIGRTEQEFETLVAEIDRLRRDYKKAKSLQVLSDARLYGENEAYNYLLKYSYNDDISVESNALIKSTQQMESKITGQIETELLNAKEKKINPLLDEVSSYYCHQILNLECQTKLYRQKYTLDRLNVLKEALLEQCSRHEIFALLIEEESCGLSRLKSELSDIKEYNEEKLKLFVSQRAGISGMKDSLTKWISGKVVNSQLDSTMFALGKSLNVEGLGPVITYDSLSLAVKLLVENLGSNLLEVNKQRDEILLFQDQILSGLKNLRKELGIGSQGRAALEEEEFTLALSKFESKLRYLEVSVKDLFTEWDKEKQKLKRDPHLLTQKKIWIDFFNNPKLMEINVQCMMNKANQ